jgi:uncharacterized membrane protein YGL010W
MSLDKLFDQYAHSHQNKWNKLCHRIGLPLMGAAIIWMITDFRDLRAWYLFAAGFAFQIVGHAIEGTRPEFLRNPIFVIIGPMYFVKQIFGKKQVRTRKRRAA